MPDAGSSKTVVAVAIAKLGEPAVVAQFADGGSFVGTGRASSAAAGRLSYVYGLKASAMHSGDAYHSLHFLHTYAVLRQVINVGGWPDTLWVASAYAHRMFNLSGGQLPCSVFLSRLQDSKGNRPPVSSCWGFVSCVWHT